MTGVRYLRERLTFGTSSPPSFPRTRGTRMASAVAPPDLSGPARCSFGNHETEHGTAAVTVDSRVGCAFLAGRGNDVLVGSRPSPTPARSPEGTHRDAVRRVHEVARAAAASRPRGSRHRGPLPRFTPGRQRQRTTVTLRENVRPVVRNRSTYSPRRNLRRVPSLGRARPPRTLRQRARPRDGPATSNTSRAMSDGSASVNRTCASRAVGFGCGREEGVGEVGGVRGGGNGESRRAGDRPRAHGRGRGGDRAHDVEPDEGGAAPRPGWRSQRSPS